MLVKDVDLAQRSDSRAFKKENVWYFLYWIRNEVAHFLMAALYHCTNRRQYTCHNRLSVHYTLAAVI
jgi:hypothetical protein